MSEFKVEILQEGQGPNCPSGAQCVMHYHGTLADGSVFDSSVARNEPFQCQIGVGQVIKGWDQGILQMNKGAKAKLTCPPDFAYGADGYPPIIPANATLTFEVTLLDFKA